MAYEMKDNTGSLFANDRKTKDTHPSHKGQAKIGGVEYWVSAWVKESNSGKRYFSFAFEPKDEQRAVADAQAPDNRYASGPADMSDDVPFMPER